MVSALGRRETHARSSAIAALGGSGTLVSLIALRTPHPGRPTGSSKQLWTF